MQAESQASQIMSDKLARINQAYQGDRKQMSTAQSASANKDDKVVQGYSDEDRSGNRASFVYNELLNGVSDIAAGLGDIGTQLLTRGLPGGGVPFQNNIVRSPEEEASANQAIRDYRENVAPQVRGYLKDKIGADVDKVLENKYRDETFTGAIGGLARTLPAIGATALSGGTGSGALFLQSYDNALASLDSSEAGRNLDDATKTIYATGLGIVTSSLEKFGLDKIMKGETGVVSNILMNKILKEATEETGGKITGTVFNRIMDQNVKEVAKRFAKGGAKAVDSYLTEFATGAGQEGATIASEYLINSATGKPVFDMSDTDGWVKMSSRIAKAGNMEGIGGGLLGTVSALGGFKRADVQKKEQSIKDIDVALQNPDMSDVAKEVLVQNKIKLQDEVQEVADAIDKKYESLNPKQKEEVASIVEKKAKIEESILDVNVSEEAKKLLQAESELLDKQLAEIKPVEGVKAEKPVVTPIEGENATEPIKLKDSSPEESATKLTEKIFSENKNISEIGTKEQYKEYLKTIFPESKLQDVVYHGSKTEGIEKFDKSKISGYLEGQDTRKGFYFSPKEEQASIYGNVYPVLLDMKNPTVGKSIADSYLKSKNGDGFVGQYESGDSDIIAYEPDQIHILGSKSDIDGFKKFVNEKSVQVDNKTENVEAKVVETPEPVEARKTKYEDIDAMTNPDEVANNLYDEIVEPTELSPVEQAIRNAGGFNTTQESYARFGDRNNIGQQMAKSYFKKGAQSLDVIAQELSKDGLEVTPQDLVDYMDKYQDGNTTYSGRAKALQNKLQDMTGKKYNKFTVKKYIDKINTEARKNLEAQPDILDQPTIDVIESEGITAENIDSLKDKIDLIYGDQTFTDIKNYLNGSKETNARPTDVSGTETPQVSGESGGLQEQPQTEREGTAETIKGTVLELPKAISDAGYEVGVVKVGDKFYAVEKQSKKNVSKGFDTEQEVIDAFDANKDKLTVEAMEQATGVKPKVVESKSDAPVKESAKKDMTASERIRALKVGKGKAFDAVLGIPVFVWDSALETIATAIDAGKAISQAIKEGIAYIKSKQSDINEQEVQAEITKQLEDAGVILKGTDVENPVPEVIEEAEQSPEDIAAEEIAEFKKRLDKAMKQAKVSTLIKTGVVKGTLAVDAIKKIGAIEDHKSMLSAVRAVRKVFNDIVKNAYISQIQQAKKGLITRLKGSKLGKTELMKKYLAINEKQLDIKDIEAYNALTRKLNDQYNARLEGVVADTEIQRFVDRIADKKVKEILDEQKVVEESEGTNNDEETISGRRKQLNAAVAINRQTLRNSPYSERFRPVAKALLNINTESLSNSEMVNLNLALVNLAVNDRLVGHEQVFKQYVGQQGLSEVKLKVGDKIKGLLESELGASARTLDINSKIIFKGVKDASIFQESTGMQGISRGNSKLNNIDMKSLDSEYNDLLKKLKINDSNDAESRYSRAIYANATQFDSIEGQGKDFKRYKSLIKQSADILEQSKNSREQREGKLINDLYDRYLAPFESREAFEDNFKKENPKAVAVVDFFRDKFNTKYPELETNSQIYAGKNIGKINNYLPLKYKRHQGTDNAKARLEDNDILEPVYSFDPETGDVSEKQSSTTISRTKVAKLKSDARILDMDFDRVMFQKYREMNYDIRTLKDRHLYNAIKSQDGFADVVGGKENSNVLTDGVRTMVKRQMNANYDHNKMQAILKASRIVTAKSVRQALFGVSQYIKQYPSVAIRTLVNLKGDVPLFIKGVTVGANNPIFDQFGIGLRSGTKGGTNFEADLNQLSKADFSDGNFNKFMNKLSTVASKYADVISKPLANSDAAVAKHSWIAYYLEDIQRKGGDIKSIDFDTEYLNPDLEAGAYADLMTSTTQNTNDNSKQADLLYDNNDGWTIIKNIVAPFSSFARNSQANLEADLRMFSDGSKAEKQKAALGITATVIESIAFNTVKIALIAPLIKAIATAITGIEPPEERESKTSKVLKNSTSDVLFSGLGSLANYWTIKGVNQAKKSIEGSDKDLFFQYDPAKYNEPDFGMAGIYGIMPQLLYNAGKKLDYLDGKLEGYYDSKGKEYKATTDLTPKEQATVSILFLMDALALTGFSEAEVNRIGQGVFREINKAKTPVKSFQLKYPNKKGGASKERIE